MKMEIPYVIVPVGDSIDIVNKLTLLNSTSKSWGVQDYIHAYKMFIPDYFRLHKLVCNTSTETMINVCLALDKPSSYIAHASKVVRSGEFTIENPNLEAMAEQFNQINITAKLTNICTTHSTDVHHMKGRIGPLLTDTKFFLAVCRSCHTWIEEHPKEAKELGYSISRSSQ